MHGREVELKPRVALKPGPHQLTAVRAHVVADYMDGGDGGRESTIDFLEQLDDFNLALAPPA